MYAFCRQTQFEEHEICHRRVVNWALHWNVFHCNRLQLNHLLAVFDTYRKQKLEYRFFVDCSDTYMYVCSSSELREHCFFFWDYGCFIFTLNNKLYLWKSYVIKLLLVRSNADTLKSNIKINNVSKQRTYLCQKKNVYTCSCWCQDSYERVSVTASAKGTVEHSINFQLIFQSYFANFEEMIMFLVH